jgi:endogenous inhibitor of DNA gyrase (YacG/DUF329 family)
MKTGEIPGDLKASEHPCRGCGATIPAQPRGPGRPRLYCSRRCRRAHYQRLEQAEVVLERTAQRERRRLEIETEWYGVREAKRRARDRAGKS